MPPTVSDPSRTALLLDVDGTLLDIAPTPQQVVVPSELRATLAALQLRFGGALALVSGRPLAELDRLFAPLRLPAVGGHGAELRVDGQSAAFGEAVALDAELLVAVEAAARVHPGVLIEQKGYSVALHYRLAPSHGPGLVRQVKRILELQPSSDALELLHGKAVIEIKSNAFDKGTAVRALMRHPPFEGRTPVFIGDDKTDEHAFAVMPELEGCAFSVGRRLRGAQDHFASPSAVRAWLAGMARCGERAAIPSR